MGRITWFTNFVDEEISCKEKKLVVTFFDGGFPAAHARQLHVVTNLHWALITNSHLYVWCQLHFYCVPISTFFYCASSFMTDQVFRRLLLRRCGLPPPSDVSLIIIIFFYGPQTLRSGVINNLYSSRVCVCASVPSRDSAIIVYLLKTDDLWIVINAPVRCGFFTWKTNERYIIVWMQILFKQ